MRDSIVMELGWRELLAGCFTIRDQDWFIKHSETFMDERKSFLVKHLGLRGIAIFEAGKGLLALGAGFLLLTLRHKDYKIEALRLLRFLHINPGRHVAQGLLRFAGNMTDHKLWLFFAGVL